MKIKAFGCSFIYGTDLDDRQNVWPCQIAARLGVEFENHAQGGIGNLRILHSLLSAADTNDICVINFTWIDRHDYVDAQDQWQTLTPTTDSSLATCYYRDLHSQYRDMLANLLLVKSAIDFLNQNKIPFLITYMDKLLLEHVLPVWHPGPAIARLQQSVAPYLHDFDGMTFLEWSRAKGYPESATWHPLDQAHSAAADFMFDRVQKLTTLDS